jgi:hypothetical protein
MAKSSIGRSGGTSRIKFVMFDAEIADDQIQSVTQAITNALRGNMSGPAVKRIAAVAANDASDVPAHDEAEAEYEEASEEDAPSRAASRPRGPRKAPKAPDVIPLDMHAGVSLADFAAGKDSNSQHKKYLIAAAWLKEHRSINAVGASHIYTCFRSMEWSVNIPDFWQPLRDLKAKKYFVKNEAGEYEINHIGLDYVKKLGSNGAG